MILNLVDITILDVLHIGIGIATLIIVIFYELDRHKRIKNIDEIVQNRILNIIQDMINEYHSQLSSDYVKDTQIQNKINKDLYFYAYQSFGKIFNSLLHEFPENYPMTLWGLCHRFNSQMRGVKHRKEACKTFLEMRKFFKNKKKYNFVLEELNALPNK